MAVKQSLVVSLSAMWVSRALTIALNLLLLPVLFHHFPGRELGAWLLLGQAGVILSFLDFGLTSVLTRRIAFASVAQAADGSDGRAQRLGELIAAARLLFRCAAAFAFAVSVSAGWWLLAHIGLEHALLTQVRAAWMILSAAYAVTLSGGLWSASVWGLGYMTAASVVNTACGVATLATQVTAVLLGGGMETLATVALCGAVLQRCATLRLLRRREPALVACTARARWPVMADLIVPSLQYWLTELGAVLLLRTDQFFIAGFRDTAQIPAYYAAYSLVYNMAMVAMSVGDVSFVPISRLWREGAVQAAHALVLRNACVALALMMSGAATMAIIGDAVMAVWLGPDHFIGVPILLTFCVMLTLFVQQSIMFGFSRATEHEAFAACYLTAGALNLGFTWALGARFGLFGVAVATLVAQLLTTNWYVPNSALRRLRLSWSSYLASVVLPAALVASATCLAVCITTSGMRADWAVHRVAVGGMAGLVAMSVGLAGVIFHAPLRDQLRLASDRIFMRRLRAPNP